MSIFLFPKSFFYGQKPAESFCFLHYFFSIYWYEICISTFMIDIFFEVFEVLYFLKLCPILDLLALSIYRISLISIRG